MSELADNIETNAAAPKKVSSDQTTVEVHSIPDQIAAAKFVGAKAAVRTNTFGIRRIKMEPPGTV